MGRPDLEPQGLGRPQILRFWQGNARRRGAVGLAALLLVLIPAPTGAADPADSSPPRIDHGESAQVRLVLLPASVTGRGGKIVRGLEAEDFQLFEDHVPQEIKYFGTEASLPISVAFLLDLSGSMRQPGKLDAAKEAIRTFVDALQPEDRVGLIGFADDQVAWITEFTRDRRRFFRRLSVQEGYGQTALYDAMAAAPGLVDLTRENRKAIVLITDGIDNASRMNTFTASRVARTVDVPIFGIGFSGISKRALAQGSQTSSLRVLELFCRETGGEMYTVHQPRDLDKVVSRIDVELRFGYVIGYYPTRKVWDGSFREVKLEPTNSAYTVRTRRGYYANP